MTYYHLIYVTCTVCARCKLVIIVFLFPFIFVWSVASSSLLQEYTLDSVHAPKRISEEADAGYDIDNVPHRIDHKLWPRRCGPIS